MIFVFAQISRERGKCGIFRGNVLIIYMDTFILFILIKTTNLEYDMHSGLNFVIIATIDDNNNSNNNRTQKKK